MALSILSLLANRPSNVARLQQILGLMPQPQPGVSGGPVSSTPGTSDPNVAGNTVNGAPASYTMSASGGIVASPTNDGSARYAYRYWDKPYAGVPSNMVTRHGVTLQRGPMRSLVDIARASSILPGTQEIGQISEGYRDYGSQAAAYRRKPGIAASPGYSYHGQGLAIDAAWWRERAKLYNALLNAGWNQFAPGYEPWHFSYGVTG